jgi:hypothetical protein
LGLEVIEAGLEGGWGTGTAKVITGGSAKLDETVAVALLDPFIDDSAGPGTVHVRTEDGSLVLEETRLIKRDVAASLGEEDRDWVVLGLILEKRVS